MIDLAKETGADAIKFQTFTAESSISRTAEKASYQKLNSNNRTETQFDMVKKLELNKSDHIELISHCKKAGIIFMSSPFDIESINLLNGLGLNIFKVPSGEIINLPYLRRLGSLNKRIIMSTGMANITELHAALSILKSSGTNINKISLLHTNTEYPTPFHDVNLRAIDKLKEEFGLEIGYSDHTKGIEVAIAAVALGATIIEKHFTLDTNMEGPDHIASSEPQEFKTMVKCIRNIETSLGVKEKKVTPSEMKNMMIVRKSLVAARPIKSGEIFSEENIAVKRPGFGISPMMWDTIIGEKSRFDFKTDEIIKT